MDGNLIRLVRNGNDFDFSCTKAADLYQLDDELDMKKLTELSAMQEAIKIQIKSPRMSSKPRHRPDS